jgi:hypothetical protein
MKMVLSLEARVFLVEHVFRCGGEYTEEVKQKFAEMFSESHEPHHNTLRQFIDAFMETGPIADAQRSGRPRVLTENKVLGTSDRIKQSPKTSIRKL